MNRKLVCKTIDVLEVEQVAIPTAPPKGLVVKVCYAGICHSDLHGYHDKGVYPSQLFPRVLGHEISGIVHSVGNVHAKEDVAYKVGDRVVAHSWGGCQACDACNAGHHVLCKNKTSAEAECFGVGVDGGFQDYLVVQNPWRLVKLSPSSDFAVSCLMPCSAVTGYNAIELSKSAIETAIEIKGYANVLLNGAGGLALWTTEIIKSIYGNKVKLCATDILEEKLADIKAKGADMTLCLPKTGETSEIAKQIVTTFGGVGVDAAIDFVNLPKTQENLFACLVPGATQVLVGIFDPKMGDLNNMKFILAQIRLQGCFAGSKPQLIEVLKLLEEGKITGPPVTIMQFDEIESTMKSMVSGTPYRGRYVVEINKP